MPPRHVISMESLNATFDTVLAACTDKKLLACVHISGDSWSVHFEVENRKDGSCFNTQSLAEGIRRYNAI